MYKMTKYLEEESAVKEIKDALESREINRITSIIEKYDLHLPDLLDRELAEAMYGNCQAEEIYQRQKDEAYGEQHTTRIPLQRWQHGPFSRDGYKQALKEYHEKNHLTFPKKFHQFTKAQYKGMFYGILNHQEKRDE